MSTIACFGDSLIEGFPFSQENSWVAQVEKVTGIPMLNHGICGECCDDIKDRLIWRPLQKGITHVLFEGGMNDIIQGCPLPFSIEQIKSAKKFCDEQGVPFCLVLPWFCGAEELNPLIERMRNAMLKEFDGQCFLLDFEPLLAKEAKRMSWFIWDGVHPKAETYVALGDFASPLLQSWISLK
ncbi:MAG: hypothetical protein J5915_00180 [Acidaminococcaceae bacterium]|jgi:lysophospholipase L1-like esterase|nr:hypothetical protein [Acidaminococcaceae bacterium]MBQ5345011.1 hypothetical protein [Acidaminococcaceae bacterium]